MIKKGGKEAEVYWRLIMCHYCLFYEKDTYGRMIPIILNPDLTDPADMSLRRDLAAHMTEQERPHYEAELQKIDRILDKYRLLKDQVQYDIFISVKQENEDGHHTTDSDIAASLYDFLVDQGLKVFNSSRTMPPPGQEYEPYIISALMSAKILIVVGTTPDNMNSPWVKNEWSRFQWLQYREEEKAGKTERILICYLSKDMRAKEIPKALHPNRQAIYDGVKAHDELMAVLAFLIETQKSEAGIGGRSRKPQVASFSQIEKQMKFWLLKEKYDKVLEKYNELTGEGLYLGYASLHLSALCAKENVSDIMQIINSDFILEDAAEYKDAVLLCDDEKEKQTLEGYLAQNRKWRKNQELIKGTKSLQANRENELKQNEQVRNDHNKKESETTAAINTEKGLQKTVETSVNKKVDTKSIKEDTGVKSTALKTRKSGDADKDDTGNGGTGISRKWIIGIAAVAILTICFAVSRIGGGARKADTSNDENNSVINETITEKDDSYNIGDTVFFGTYEQDDNTVNGEEDIEWIVLTRDGDRVLLISKYALDCKPYNTSFSPVTWETCSLREWLNETFVNNAFNSDEQKMIISSNVTADTNPSYSTSPGSNTTDKVFLLSITEVNEYFNSDSARQCQGTAYCYAQGEYESINGNCFWWLRSPGDLSDYATYVHDDGYVDNYGNYVDYGKNAVRPALWINLGS